MGTHCLHASSAQCLIVITRKAVQEVQLCAAQVFKRPSPSLSLHSRRSRNSLSRARAVQLPAKVNLHRFTILTGQPPFVLEVLWILGL